MHPRLLLVLAILGGPTLVASCGAAKLESTCANLLHAHVAEALYEGHARIPQATRCRKSSGVTTWGAYMYCGSRVADFGEMNPPGFTSSGDYEQTDADCRKLLGANDLAAIHQETARYSSD